LIFVVRLPGIVFSFSLSEGKIRLPTMWGRASSVRGIWLWGYSPSTHILLMIFRGGRCSPDFPVPCYLFLRTPLLYSTDLPVCRARRRPACIDLPGGLLYQITRHRRHPAGVFALPFHVACSARMPPLPVVESAGHGCTGKCCSCRIDRLHYPMATYINTV